MTGRLVLDGAGLSSASRRREPAPGVARIDLLSRGAEVEVHSVTIRRIADQGYVAGDGTPSTPAAASWKDFRRDYGEAPLTIAPRDAALPLRAAQRRDGGRGCGPFRRREVAPLEKQVSGASASQYGLYAGGLWPGRRCRCDGDAAGDWDEGFVTESSPVLRGLVDASASQLPEAYG